MSADRKASAGLGAAAVSDPKASPSSLVTVRFHDDDLFAIKDERGVWVPVKRVCEALGVAEQRQAEKLKGKAWAVTTMMVATGSDGKRYTMHCIHVAARPSSEAWMRARREVANVLVRTLGRVSRDWLASQIGRADSIVGDWFRDSSTRAAPLALLSAARADGRGCLLSDEEFERVVDELRRLRAGAQ